MDLPPDKAKVLKAYDDEKKWEMVCDQVRSLTHIWQICSLVSCVYHFTDDTGGDKAGAGSTSAGWWSFFGHCQPLSTSVLSGWSLRFLRLSSWYKWY